MTNPNEKEWWKDSKFQLPCNDINTRAFDMKAILKEATRRGEKKAWEEANRIVKKKGKAELFRDDAWEAAYADGFKVACNNLQEEMEAKLASLTNDKEV